MRGRAGGCAQVTAGQNRPHLGLCPGHNVPLQGRQASRGCIPDSPGESDLVSRGSKGLRSPLELRRDSRVTKGISGFLLCWPGKPNLPFELRGRAGGCARVTAGQKKPHPGLCLGPNVPLKGVTGILGLHSRLTQAHANIKLCSDL